MSVESLTEESRVPLTLAQDTRMLRIFEGLRKSLEGQEIYKGFIRFPKGDMWFEHFTEDKFGLARHLGYFGFAIQQLPRRNYFFNLFSWRNKEPVVAGELSVTFLDSVREYLLEPLVPEKNIPKATFWLSSYNEKHTSQLTQIVRPLIQEGDELKFLT